MGAMDRSPGTWEGGGGGEGSLSKCEETECRPVSSFTTLKVLPALVRPRVWSHVSALAAQGEVRSLGTRPWVSKGGASG